MFDKNFLSLIYKTEGLSTHFWIKKILEQSSKIKAFRNILQSSTISHDGMFYNSAFENSLTLEKVPDYSISF